MNSPVFLFMFLGVALPSWIHPSIAKCDRSGCKSGTRIEFSNPIAGPNYYSPPGPITLTCNVSGDLQYIDWERRSADGVIEILNSKTTRNVSSYWIATIDNYLLKEKFPFTYQCTPVDSCCRKGESETKTLNFRSISSFSESCIKDVLVVLDTSGSIHSSDVDDKFKPFLRRLVDDPRLIVSQGGSHIAIISFSEVSATKIRLPFSEVYNKSIIDETINMANSWFIPGTRTMTWAALKLANEIFAKESPNNHRPDKDDVIVLITDGIPTRSTRGESRKYPPRSSARKLRQKGVRIVGISYSDVYQKVRDFIKNISTPGEALETSLEDIKMIVDRIVDGFCLQPATVPGKPQNVTIALIGNSIKVSWLPPNVPNEDIDYYIISWRNGNGSFCKKNITSSPFIVPNLDNLGSYDIKIQAVSHVGIGVAVRFNNVLISGGSTTPSLLMVFHTTIGRKSESQTVAIAGGVTGSVFLLLAVITLFFLRKRIRIKKREQSVKEFESWHERHAMSSNAPTSALLELESLNKKRGSETEEISYVVLLKNWEISPSHLTLQDKTLGAGQFGIVKQGLYTPSKDCEPEIVAVKMLKDSARESDFSDILAELEILKKINSQPHPNVIRFIGGCTVEGKLLVVTEFCAGGNLQKFLRKSKVSYNTENVGSNYVNITSTLDHRQLLKMAVDVANGMVHLSAQKFVHRDLAARNILLANDNVAKVSDFGLARDIESAEEYIRSNQNLLPVKWMALESLLHGRFTTASDVWSFGILLYEIATLGEEPYKNLSAYNIISHVGCGCRMSKPSHCSSEIYEIMTNCWKVDPKHRPTFSEIWQDLNDMLSDDETPYIKVYQVKEEGLQNTTEPSEVKMKERHVTA